MESTPVLVRRVGTLNGLGFALTLVVGSGILGLPGMSIGRFGPVVPLYAWILTIVSMVPLIFIFVRLGEAFPTADGILQYAEVVFGPRGRYAATSLILGTIVLGVPFVGYICAAYLASLPILREAPVGATALLIFWAVTWMNLRGVKLSSRMNQVSMIVLATLGLGIVFGHLPYLTEGLRLLARPVEFEWQDLSACSLLLFWAFIGWEELSFGLEEFRGPKTISRVYWLSYLCVALLYFSIALTASGAHASGIPILGAGGLQVLIPIELTFLVAAGIFVVAVSNTSSNVYVYSRMAFAAARAGILPKPLQHLSPNAIPTTSLVVMTALYSIVIIVVEFTDLSWSALVSLVDQNFVLLYWLAILAFVRVDKTVWRWPIAAAAFASSWIFLSQISWTVLYPIALILFGAQYGKRRARFSL